MNKLKKILIVFGTRPEAIKMAPLVIELQAYKDIFDARICVTAQHRQMLDQVLEIFEIKPDYDLDIMKEKQDLYDITSNVLLKIKSVLDEFNPDFVLVHGDTTTSFAAALAAFYKQIKICHIEAGLRTYDMYNPWPEEANRVLTSKLTKFHFAPTKRAMENLLNEKINKDNILITGNTVIDALFWVLNKIKNTPYLEKEIYTKLQKEINSPKFDIKSDEFVLITAHRRENFGQGFINICNAIRKVAIVNKNFHFVYPVHFNPNVRKPVNEILSGISNVHLINPLDYLEFSYLMNLSNFIITDSGGIQEEAPSIGKPVLLLRNTTERPEALNAGVVKLVGTNVQKIIKETQNLLNNKLNSDTMQNLISPYGDGKASVRIVDFLKKVVL